MRKFASVLGFLVIATFALPLPVHAQKAEVFGGYSYLRLDTSPGSANFNGWNASLTVKPVKILGLTADFGGTYASPGGVKTNLYTFLFGPQLNLPLPGVSPFVHALFGGARVSALGASTTSFATAIGGGIDVHPLPVVGLRLIQVDYLNTNFGSTHQNNFRLSAGVVLRF